MNAEAIMRVAWRGEFKLTLSVMRVLFSFVTREKATGHGRKMKALEVSAVANLQLDCLFFLPSSGKSSSSTWSSPEASSNSMVSSTSSWLSSCSSARFSTLSLVFVTSNPLLRRL